jgi:hypothetical protein
LNYLEIEDSREVILGSGEQDEKHQEDGDNREKGRQEHEAQCTVSNCHIVAMILIIVLARRE